MNNPDNQKKNKSKNDDFLISVLAIKFTHKTELPMHINLEDFNIYAKEKNNTKNVLKDTIYQYLFDTF